MTDQTETPFVATGTVNIAKLNLRRVPDENAPDSIVSEMPGGTTLKIVAKVQNAQRLWYKVDIDELPDGGYVAAEFVALQVTIEPCPADVLDVPWHTQLQSDGRGYDLCGETDVEMLLDYYKKAHGDLLEMAGFLGKWGRPTGFSDLIRLAGHYGLMLELQEHDGDLTRMREVINAARQPVIALVEYGLLPFPSHLVGGKNQGAHWLLIRGINNDTVWVNDPLWLASQRQGNGGACLTLTVAQFERALIPNLANHVAIY